ncbi:B12-binding domain-containing radical SAM protein [Falsiroseomonas sp. E2-1-a20]|uniref:B12-binding domain-containing radical SAM protein n=1 Tax=Falsiroseomonas sp. E2-1-a20 TaxID=3239300 RepID=UPI003F316778
MPGRVEKKNILIVDLNNFAHYPTIAVGMLCAALRAAGHAVTVFSPLSVGVTGFGRAGRSHRLGHIDSMLRLVTAMSGNALVRGVRARAARLIRPDTEKIATRIFEAFRDRLGQAGPDVVLVSAYTMYLDAVRLMAMECARRGVPLIVGGSYFNDRAIAADWLALPGVSAVVAGEAEPFVSDLVQAATARAALDGFPGVWTAGSNRQPGPPLRDLDSLPFADYADFPWQRYPNRIVPIMTGRGCGWGVCTFCSDVTTVAGRSFRSRSPGNVLDEISYQSARHDAKLFVMLDLKLNSSLPVWHALIDQMPKRVPGARWTASVHVGLEEANGLSLDELRAARAAGLVRMTTGLESGSQRVLNTMAKGTRVARTSQFIRDVAAAGISLRTTVIVGHPNETPADLAQTARFLESHAFGIERVMVNRFSVMPGTPIHDRMLRSPGKFPGIRFRTLDARNAVLEHYNGAEHAPGFHGALWRLLTVSNRINRQKMNPAAEIFEGVL